MDRPAIEPGLLRELHRFRHQGWVRLAAFVALYVASAAAAYVIVMRVPGGPWKYLACLPLYLLAAASLHGINLFTHEAVHGTLCPNRVFNDALGACAPGPSFRTVPLTRCCTFGTTSTLAWRAIRITTRTTPTGRGCCS